MEIVCRALIVYLAILFLLRIAGKRAINESQPFGLILILLISSSVSDAIKDQDHSITAGLLLAVSLMGIHIAFSFFKSRSHKFTRVIDDVPTVLVRSGVVFESELRKAKVSREDILLSARQNKLVAMKKIKYAILEIDGSISIIPEESE